MKYDNLNKNIVCDINNLLFICNSFKIIYLIKWLIIVNNNDYFYN